MRHTYKQGLLPRPNDSTTLRCGQQMTHISRKRFERASRLFGGGLLHSMSILTEKFQALMAGKP